MRTRGKISVKLRFLDMNLNGCVVTWKELDGGGVDAVQCNSTKPDKSVKNPNGTAGPVKLLVKLTPGVFSPSPKKHDDKSNVGTKKNLVPVLPNRVDSHGRCKTATNSGDDTVSVPIGVESSVFV